jgi:hypothetical protein
MDQMQRHDANRFQFSRLLQEAARPSPVRESAASPLHRASENLPAPIEPSNLSPSPFLRTEVQV